MKKEQGFTLIELVVVIVILGILAATAAPKFVDLQDDAKTATIQAAKGSFEDIATLIYSKSVINGTEAQSPSSVEIDGVNVATVYGYPRSNDAAALTIMQDNLLNLSSDYGIALKPNVTTFLIYPLGLYEASTVAAESPILLPCVASYKEPLFEGFRPEIFYNPC